MIHANKLKLGVAETQFLPLELAFAGLLTQNEMHKTKSKGGLCCR